MEELKFIDSKFRLAILAAKRAKQLIHGDKKKIEINAENPLTIALKEIEEGKINFKILKKGEKNIPTGEEELIEMDENGEGKKDKDSVETEKDN